MKEKSQMFGWKKERKSEGNETNKPNCLLSWKKKKKKRLTKFILFLWGNQYQNQNCLLSWKKRKKRGVPNFFFCVWWGNHNINYNILFKALCTQNKTKQNIPLITFFFFSFSLPSYNKRTKCILYITLCYFLYLCNQL